MIYQTKINHKSPTKIFSKFAGVFLVCLIIFAFNRLVPELIPNLFSPLVRLGNYFYVNVFGLSNIFSSKDNLILENEKISSQISDLQIKLIDFDSIKKENERLHRELGLRPLANLISAKVMARPPEVPLDSLLIDKGSDDGLVEGDWVLVGERVLVGKLTKVYKNKATVVLNSFSGKLAYGYLERTNEPIEIKGVGGGSMQIRVPIDFDIALQDKVMVEGNRAYVLAVVKVVEEDQASGFKNILLALPTNVFDNKIVFIESINR